MDTTQPIPPYRHKRRHNPEDVVAKELQRQRKEVIAEKQKNHKLKKRCKNLEARCDEQKDRRKKAERALSQERSNAGQREMMLRLQTKLDDLDFYRGPLKGGRRR